jgi:uncharacterized protein
VGLILAACLAGFLLGQVAAAVFIALGASIAHYPGGLSAVARASAPPWWANALSLAGLWLGFGSAISFARRRGALAQLSGQWRVERGDWRYVALGIGCQIAVALGYAPFHLQRLDRPVHHLFDTAHGVTLVLLGALTIVGAPVLEEWFFRGVLYRTLRTGLARVAPRAAVSLAVLASAALFGLAHGELLQFAGLLFLGAVLAVLVERTGRLMPSVLTHATFNSVAFAALLVHRSGR